MLKRDVAKTNSNVTISPSRYSRNVLVLVCVVLTTILDDPQIRTQARFIFLKVKQPLPHKIKVFPLWLISHVCSL